MTRQRTEDIRDIAQGVIADADTRASLQGGDTIIGYDDGYFVTSPDNRFLLRFRGQLQLRWVMDHRNKMPGQDFGQENVDQFQLRRSKLHFHGHLFDPSLSYRLTLATNTRTLGDSAESKVFIENAFIQKSFDNGMFVRLGQYKGPIFVRRSSPARISWPSRDPWSIRPSRTSGRRGSSLAGTFTLFHLRAMYNDGPRQLNVGAYQTRMRSILARAEVVLAGEHSDFRTLTNKDADEFSLMIGGGFQWYLLKNSDWEWVYGNVEADRTLGFTVDVSMFDEVGRHSAISSGQTARMPNSIRPNSVDSWGWVGQAGITVHENVQLYIGMSLVTSGTIAVHSSSRDRRGISPHSRLVSTGGRSASRT